MWLLATSISYTISLGNLLEVGTTLFVVLCFLHLEHKAEKWEPKRYSKPKSH